MIEIGYMDNIKVRQVQYIMTDSKHYLIIVLTS